MTRRDDSPDIDGYTCLELLGEGGMGRVYRAIQLDLDREVALKVVHPGTSHADAVGRFLREARVMATVRHPHLVQLLDAGRTEAGAPWIAMELVEGEPLDVALAREGTLPPPRARGIMMEVAEALDALHARGVVHRDVKPANVLLDRAGRARLMDLGVARAIGESSMTGTGVVLGTSVYLSPEALRGEEPDSREDWYAWGVTWWELLTGRVPLSEKELVQRAASRRPPEIPLPSPRGGRLEEGERAALRAVLGPRDARPSRAQEVLGLLRVFPAGEEERKDATRRLVPPPGETRGAVSGRRAATTRRRGVAKGRPRARSLGFALASVGVLALALGVAWVLRAPSGPRTEPRSSALPVVVVPAVELRYRDASSLLLRVGRLEAPGLVASRVDRGVIEPVPVYEMGSRGAFVWLGGLQPDEAGELLLDHLPSGWSLAVPFGPAAGALPPGAAQLPWALRRHLLPLVGTGARAEAEEYLRWLSEACPEDHDQTFEEVFLLPGMGRGARVPDAAWPRLLARLARGGRQAANLLRAFRLWEVSSPPSVSWMILHLLPGWGARRWLEGEWSAAERLAGVALRGCRVPPGFSEVLVRWLDWEPRLARGVYTEALWMARHGEGAEAFPYQVPGWTRREDQPEEGAPPSNVLDRVLARGAPSLEEVAALEETERLFSIALLGLGEDRPALIRWLLETYRSGSVAEARAADVALEMLKEATGQFWSCGDQGTLWFWGVDDAELRDLRLEAEGVVAHRREAGRVWVWFPGKAAEVSWVYARDGRRFEHPIKCQ